MYTLPLLRNTHIGLIQFSREGKKGENEYARRAVDAFLLLLLSPRIFYYYYWRTIRACFFLGYMTQTAAATGTVASQDGTGRRRQGGPLGHGSTVEGEGSGGGLMKAHEKCNYTGNIGTKPQFISLFLFVS